MLPRPIAAILLVAVSFHTNADFDAVGADRTVSVSSAYPTAIAPATVGSYPGSVKSGAGYFYDEVLEYRVWLHPERGAPSKGGGATISWLSRGTNERWPTQSSPTALRNLWFSCVS